MRQIASFVDLSWVYSELAPYYSAIGWPSIDPVLMIRMLIIGYVFAIRSERQLCREVHVWTAPVRQDVLVETTKMVGCSHVSGLLMRFT